MDRRHFLLGSSALSVVLASRRALADQERRVLVLVELKGGNDGLNTVVPYADPLYRQLRPGIGVARDKTIQLDERVGLNGRIFKVWKFRSMRQDAEKDGVPRWATAKDNRVTKVGRFIRATRIDEIPQIINVLQGDMSFIGPRPERPYFVQQLRRETH